MVNFYAPIFTQRHMRQKVRQYGTVLTHLHIDHDSIFRLLFRLPTRGTTYSFLVGNMSNFLVKGRKLVYSLYRRTNDSEPTIVLNNLFIGTRDV